MNLTRLTAFGCGNAVERSLAAGCCQRSGMTKDAISPRQCPASGRAAISISAGVGATNLIRER